jgi:phosphatidylglycerophosphate synthase
VTGRSAAVVGSERARALAGRSAGGALITVGPRSRGVGGQQPTSVTRSAVAEAFDLETLPTCSGSAREVMHEVARRCGESDTVPLVVVADDLELSPVALLDVLDAPADRTAAAVLRAADVAAREGAPAPVRLSAGGRAVADAGTSRSPALDPDAFPVGVLRVAGPDRAAVATALASDRQVQTSRTVRHEATGPARVDDPFGAVLAAVVHAGVHVVAIDLAHRALTRGSWQVEGAPGSPWQQRLRAASRGNDGVFSRVAIRPLSRRVTAVGLARDWSPDVVTAVSLALGLAACAAVAVGRWWAWVAAAVLLQGSLVLDCVDGEIARFTRRSKPLGAWLDAVSDRVKEFTMLATLAWVATRRGDDLWWLALAVLCVLAVRHVEDHAYATRQQASASDAAEERPGGAPRTHVAPYPSRRVQRVSVVKQIIHLPIAERYLIMSLGLLTFSPAVVLWALGAASVTAFAWTQTGRLARALTRRDAFRPDRPDRTLASLVDLAFLPRPHGRALLAWQVPGVLLVVEAVALLVVARTSMAAQAAAYAWFAVVCWHTYDNVYRIRETGRGTARWLRRATGLEVRLAVLALIAVGAAVTGSASAGGPWLPAWLLGVGMVLLVLYVAESVASWRAAGTSESKGPQAATVAAESSTDRPAGQDGGS